MVQCKCDRLPAPRGLGCRVLREARAVHSARKRLGVWVRAPALLFAATLRYVVGRARHDESPVWSEHVLRGSPRVQRDVQRRVSGPQRGRSRSCNLFRAGGLLPFRPTIVVHHERRVTVSFEPRVDRLERRYILAVPVLDLFFRRVRKLRKLKRARHHYAKRCTTEDSKEGHDGGNTALGEPHSRFPEALEVVRRLALAERERDSDRVPKKQRESDRASAADIDDVLCVVV